MTMGNVAITGAAGAVGSVVRRGLRGEAERLTLLDRVPLRAEETNEVVHAVDLADAAAVREALEGVDAVVHLAAIPDEAPLPDLLQTNVVGTHHVLEAARRHGIVRTVLASTNRVAGFCPVSHTTSPREPVRPDGLYGVSKVAVEALGQLYADKFGLSVFCLRIGSFETEPSEPRHLATWLSPRDAVGFVRACLTAPAGPGCRAVFAVSANTRNFWEVPTDLYRPIDDAEAYADRIPGSAEPVDPKAPQAGPFAEPGFTLRHLPG